MELQTSQTSGREERGWPQGCGYLSSLCYTRLKWKFWALGQCRQHKVSDLDKLHFDWNRHL